MDDNIVWVFHHLPKTGGTTLILHLYKHFEWDIDYLHIGPFGNYYRVKHHRLNLFERPLAERKKIKAIAGPRVFDGIHKFVPNKEPRYFVFVRCPAKRLESMYNFHINKKSITPDVTFNEWYKTRHQNGIMTWLNVKLFNLMPKQSTLENVVDFLDKCWFVGITENLKEDLPKLFKVMNIPNKDWVNYRVAGERNALKDLDHPEKHHEYKVNYKMDEATRDFVYRDNPLDVEIYEYAKKRNMETRIKLN